MGLSNDLISQFVKIASDESNKSKSSTKESTVHGTIVEQGGIKYVMLDGSEILTPVTTTAKIKANDRVIVLIKNHTAIVTGNISDPSASSQHVDEVDNEVTGLKIIVADKVNVEELEAERARITDLEAENVTINDELTANKAKIEYLEAKNVTIEGKLTANEASIEELTAKDVEITNKLTANEASIEDLTVKKLSVEDAEIKYATIENLEATNVKVDDLAAESGEFKSLTAEKFTAVEGSIADLDATKLSAEDAAIKYANIEFGNITEAAIKKIFADYGVINEVIMSEGTVVKELIGVTISGDLINANTLKADKLIVLGEDGIYYKLNVKSLGEDVVSEMTEENQQELQNGLHGSNIIAKSVTAEKISVDDLVAFGATIGAFNITRTEEGVGAIYSGVKESTDNTTRGTYLDSDGQVVFGNSDNFIRFIKESILNDAGEETGEYAYRLSISAGAIYIKSSFKDVVVDDDGNETEVDKLTTIEDECRDLNSKITASIESLVVGADGSSKMTQTEDGWRFDISEIENLANSADKLATELSTDVNSLKDKTSFIKIDEHTDDTGNNQPCIELYEGDTDFRLRITNTDAEFIKKDMSTGEETSLLKLDGDDSTTTVKKANIDEAVVNSIDIENELSIGGFAWSKRSNGNVGFIWRGE